MKRIFQFTLLGSILCGCQSTPFSALHPREFLPKGEKAQPADLAANQDDPFFESGDTLEPALSQGVTNQDQIRLGQEEIAAWYDDQRGTHLKLARKHFEQALEQQPTHNADAHHGLAVVADLEERFQDAEYHYTIALAMAPRDSRILGNLGYSYFLQGRMSDSERYLTRAIEIDSKNLDALRNLGDLYTRLGKKEAALEAYTQVMSLADAEKLVAESQPTQQSLSLTERLLGRNDANAPNEPGGPIIQAHREEQTETLGNSTPQIQQAQSLQPQSHDPLQPRFPRRQPDLQNQLADIDREPYQSVSGLPIVIDGETGNPRVQTQSLAPPELTQAARPILITQEPQLPVDRSPYYTDAERAAIISTPTVTPDPSQLPNVRPSANRLPLAINGLQSTHGDKIPLTPSLPQAPASQAVEQSPDQTADQLLQPWSGSASSPISPLAQHSATHHAGAEEHHSAAGDDQPDAYQRATLVAARLGMGLPAAPSSTNPSNTTPRQSPGTNAMWNGNDFPQPKRYLPTDLPPQDLSQAMSLGAANSSHLQNSLGQQLPGSVTTQSPEQFGTASRFPITQYESPQAWNGGSAETQRLNAQREEYNQQFNQDVREVWDQRPMQLHEPQASPQGVIAPAEYAGMIRAEQENSTTRGPVSTEQSVQQSFVPSQAPATEPPPYGIQQIKAEQSHPVIQPSQSQQAQYFESQSSSAASTTQQNSTIRPLTNANSFNTQANQNSTRMRLLPAITPAPAGSPNSSVQDNQRQPAPAAGHTLPMIQPSRR